MADVSFIPASLSFYLLETTNEMRNPADEKKRRAEKKREEEPTAPVGENCALTFGKRFLGELCYASVLVLALVETVVRAIFAIPAYFITLCTGTKEGTFGGKLWGATGFGARMSLYSACAAGAALIQNVYQERISIMSNDLVPSVADCLAIK